MRLKSFLISTLMTTCLSTVSFHSAQAAIQAMASRVIYEGQAKATTLALRNNANQAYMVQSWLEAGEDGIKNAKIPFVITPPLVKIESQKETVIRFIYAGAGLPQDRESQFWVNIQEIPPKPEQENILQLAVRTKLKLFYRPQQLDLQLADAVKQLKWYMKDQTLYLENKSPLYVTIGDLKLNDQAKVVDNLNQDMVPPFGRIAVLNNLPQSTQRIHYTYINEYGGNDAMPTVQLK